MKRLMMLLSVLALSTTVMAQSLQMLASIEKNAKKGDAQAMRMLAFAYEEGKSLSQDYDLAKQWYEKAADKGDALAMYRLGLMYYDGRPTVDFKQAQVWLTRAIDNGYSAARGALYDLGVEFIAWAYMSEGDESVRNFQDAMACLRTVAQTGDGLAMYLVGHMYAKGLGVSPDGNGAMEWFRKAVYNTADDAYRGKSISMVGIGDLYRTGADGISQDYAKAAEWYRQAANMGNLRAAGHLGILLYDGKGMEQDRVKAFEMLTKAASSEAPLADALHYLSRCYRFGHGTAQDLRQADYWEKKAQETGSDEAKALQHIISGN